MKITDLDLVIMDECHHTDMRHPYAAIMEAYYTVRRSESQSRLPQIVGLTASLGVGSCDGDPAQHYIRICANLDCDIITHVKENCEELDRHVPPLKRDQILAVEPTNKNTPFHRAVIAVMNEILKMKQMKGKSVAFGFGTQPFENWAVEVNFFNFCVFHILTFLSQGDQKVEFYTYITSNGKLQLSVFVSMENFDIYGLLFMHWTSFWKLKCCSCNLH